MPTAVPRALPPAGRTVRQANEAALRVHDRATAATAIDSGMPLRAIFLPRPPSRANRHSPDKFPISRHCPVAGHIFVLRQDLSDNRPSGVGGGFGRSSADENIDERKPFAGSRACSRDCATDLGHGPRAARTNCLSRARRCHGNSAGRAPILEARGSLTDIGLEETSDVQKNSLRPPARYFQAALDARSGGPTGCSAGIGA